MRKTLSVLSVLFLAITASLATSASPQETPNAPTLGPSGNPLPRFVSLSTTKANMRTGPGRQYPVEWVYRQVNLPLEVVDEFGPWRRVKDPEGSEGWIHVRLLSGKRTAMITGRTRQLYREDDVTSPVVMTAEAGVVGSLVSCHTIWCRMEIGGTRGWVERRHLWGVYLQETFD